MVTGETVGGTEHGGRLRTEQSPTTRPCPGPATPPPLDRTERRQLHMVRHFGTLGSLLLAIASLGAGAAPVNNPTNGVRLLGLPARMPTTSLAVAYVGMAMVVLAWLWLGRLARPGRPRMLSRTQLDRTLVMWAAPLIVAPPMFSRDVYSYLAQSEIVSRGIDPYELGPIDALGPDHPLTRGVPNIWRDTPAPYGPLFLTLGRLVTAIAGDDVVLGILLQRALALAGVAMIVWALPRLARRCGVQPVSALWLGAANPLVLFHLVSGIHNEALMVGLMLAGFEIALRTWGDGPLGRVAPVVVGATLITLSACIKIPSALALGFLGAALARRWGGRLTDLMRAALLLTVIFVVALTAVCLFSGLGFGWLGALGTPNKVKSWMSPATALGMLGGGIGIALGLGNHSDAVITLTRAIGQGLSGVICLGLLWVSFRSWRGYRAREPLAGLGIALGAVVLLGPVVHPWYLLWAAIPLAAATTSRRFRRAATVISVALALAVPPPGATFDGRAYVVPQAIVAAAIATVLLLLVVRHRIPRTSETQTA